MGLQDSIARDTVSELPIREVITLPATCTVRQAMRRMRARRLGCVIAVDEQGKPVGKFTERLLMRLLVNEAGGLDQPIAKFMYADASAVSLSTPLAKLVEQMQSRHLRFMCVVNEQGKAVGLTGQKGLMEYIAEHFPRAVLVQRMKPFLALDEREGA
ncbi:MAG: CBS domain-containing protein [Phycisphaeraceae bacterium]